MNNTKKLLKKGKQIQFEHSVAQTYLKRTKEDPVVLIEGAFNVKLKGCQKFIIRHIVKGRKKRAKE